MFTVWICATRAVVDDERAISPRSPPPGAPTTDHEAFQYTVAVTVNRSPGWPAEVVR
jgi:hypothetical protein